MTIPLDYDEAARIDGAGAPRIWWEIILPLSRPVLATMALLAFIYHWNDFLRPLVFLTDKDLRTLAIGLRLFKGGVRVVTRSSPNAVYDAELATFSESGGLFDQNASPGFIELWSLQSRMAHHLRERGEG